MFKGVTVNSNIVHQYSFGNKYSKCVSVIPHSVYIVIDEVQFTTSTQYMMSGSTPVISRVKGGSQVRERVAVSWSIKLNISKETSVRFPKIG